MDAKLRRHWFLLMLAAGGLAVWLCPKWVAWASAIEPRYVVGPALFLAAWSLESRRVAQSLMRPLPAIWAIVISYGFVPLLAWLGLGLMPSSDYRIGWMLIASAPCTLASAVLWTRMAGGNEATALLVILASTSTSWLATTLWLRAGTGAEVSLDAGGMMWGLFLVLVLPVALGQLCRAVPLLARAANRHHALIGVIGRVLIFLVILKAAVDLRGRFDNSKEGIALGPLLIVLASCLALHLIALAVGYCSGRALGFDRPERIAVAFAGSQKTLPVALYLFEAYYRQYPLAVFPLFFYHVGQLIVDTFIADAWAGKAKSVELVPEEMIE